MFCRRPGFSTIGSIRSRAACVRASRNGSRTRTLTGTFGQTDITVPRARLQGADGATTEWKSGGSDDAATPIAEDVSVGEDRHGRAGGQVIGHDDVGRPGEMGA